MYCNVPVKLPYQGVVVVVTEMFYEPEQKLSFYQEHLPAVTEPLAGYAFKEETGEAVDWNEVIGNNFSIVCDALLKFVTDVKVLPTGSCMRV